MAILYQAGTLISLMQGVYDGDIDFATLATWGDTGLGTINGVDGEMIAIDGQYYRIDAQGVASIINPQQLTPFAITCAFKASQTLTVSNLTSIQELNAYLNQQLNNKNIFYMIKIIGQMRAIKLRSESCQPLPYRAFAQTVKQVQTVFQYQHMAGTLVSSFCPNYCSNLNVAGYHHHFLNEEKTTGGHVFDLAIEKATVMIMPLYELRLLLFRNLAFANANLAVTIDEAVKKTEHDNT
jgi:acetolactate decarboxylase